MYLSLLVLLPLAALCVKALHASFGSFFSVATSARALASYRVTFGASFAAALVNAPLGLLVAWVLTRYRFPGRAALDALVDLPFALPTAVAGISLTTLYAEHGFLGAPLARAGVHVAFTPLGIAVALVFIGFPFTVRTVQPVLQSLDVALEESAATLGASPAQIFWRVLFPQLRPAMLTGFVLAFARALGEYGSVVFISGNMPFKTEITPLLVMTRLEEFDYVGAAVLGLVSLGVSFLLILGINFLQSRTRRWEAIS